MPYHHGDLRRALVEAGVELAKGGPEQVALRAVTRAAGVSHNAAYRHFSDLDELLAAVAGECMAELGHLMESGLEGVPGRPGSAAYARRRLVAAGRAYVDFALSQPGWFKTAFSTPTGIWGHDHPEPARGRHPYQILSDTLDEMVAAGALAVGRRPGAEFPAWAAVHGISTLLVEGPLRFAPPEEREPAVGKVLESVLTGL